MATLDTYHVHLDFTRIFQFLRECGQLRQAIGRTRLRHHWYRNRSQGATDGDCEGVRVAQCRCDGCDQHHIGSFFVSLFAILVDGMKSVI